MPANVSLTGVLSALSDVDDTQMTPAAGWFETVPGQVSAPGWRRPSLTPSWLMTRSLLNSWGACSTHFDDSDA